MDAREIALAIGVDVVGRLPHGEGTGAYEVRMPNGTTAVLKLFTPDVLDLGISTALTDALRSRGYPIPAILSSGEVDGTKYQLQELAAGAPLDTLTHAHLALVRALIALQRGVGLPGRGPWLQEMATSVVDGRVGYCEHAAMEEHSDETRALLDRLRRIADSARHADVADDDIVHYDFSPYNILVLDDRVTAVVDWLGVTNGDAAFDLVTLAMYTYDYDVRDALLATAAALASPRALGLYAAHMVLRQVDWSLRHHDGTSVEWSMGTGAALLDAVGADD